MRSASLFLLAICLPLLAVSPLAAQSPVAVIRLDNLSLRVGETATLTVHADCGSGGCGAYDFTLQVTDPALLRPEDITLGDIFGTQVLEIAHSVDASTGTIHSAAASLGATAGSSSGVLFSVLLTALRAGTTQITVTRAQIGEITPLRVDVQGGAIRIAALATPTRTATPFPTRQPTPDLRPSLVNPAPVVSSFQPGSISEAVHYDSIWSSVDFVDMNEPGLTEYSVDVEADKQYRWVFLWCADSRQQLESILSDMTVGFFIDNTPATRIHTYSSEARCRGWVTVLTGWQRGSTAVLEIRYRLGKNFATRDGRYEAGDYIQRLYATVR